MGITLHSVTECTCKTLHVMVRGDDALCSTTNLEHHQQVLADTLTTAKNTLSIVDSDSVASTLQQKSGGWCKMDHKLIKSCPLQKGTTVLGSFFCICFSKLECLTLNLVSPPLLAL